MRGNCRQAGQLVYFPAKNCGLKFRSARSATAWRLWACILWWPNAVLLLQACATCACVAFWKLINTNEQGQRPMAVNLRMTEPEAIEHLPIDHFEGLISFKA
jgi:hypothetical protein